MRYPGLVAAAGTLLVSVVAYAAPAEPAGPHPRLFLDGATLTKLKELAAVPTSAVARAIARCDDVVANPTRWSSGGDIGFGFHEPFGACALAFKVTGKAAHGAAAVKYFKVLLDDKKTVGDGQGGNAVEESDSGFAMRSFGPYAAIGYDWLHDAPGVDAALLAHARERFKAWTEWYDPARGFNTGERIGYNAQVAGANYHAGWFAGSTLIAIAQGGEAGADGAALWAYVADTQFGKVMAPALAPDGALDGGDWSEGWQYGPLSVLEYAMAARAARENGLAAAGFAEWESELVARTIHAAVPDRTGIFNSGDFDDASPIYRSIPIQALYAAMIDAASDEAKALAAQIIKDRKLQETSFLLAASLAEARAPVGKALPADASTWYLATGTRVLHARSDWSPTAAWLTTRCMEGSRAHDHAFLDAGNLVWTRGSDHLIVDPSPYGSLSTLTTNAPTVTTTSLPESYQPSQGAWGLPTEVGFKWARQTVSGVVATRCDWRGQLRFRDEKAPDVQAALRDVIMVPWNGDAETIVLDRVDGSAANRPLLLRFRATGALKLSGNTATATVGATHLAMTLAYASSGTPAVKAIKATGSCDSQPRGSCNAARFAVNEWSVSVPGPASRAIHVLSASADVASAPEVTTEGDIRVVDTQVGGRAVFVVQRDGTAATMTYHAPRAGDALHIVVDAPRGATGRSDVTAVADGERCAVTVAAHSGAGGLDGQPLIVRLSNDCVVADEATRQAFSAPAAVEEDPRPPRSPVTGGGDGEGRLEGGCGCQTGAGAGAVPGSALAALAALTWLRRRR